VTLYLASNVMATRIIEVGDVTLFDAGTLIFPFTYFLGELLTEVFGRKQAKHVVWTALTCQLLFTLFVWIASWMPFPEESAEMAEAYTTVFRFVPRIMLASLTAFTIGELTNIHIMSYIKERFGGPLWVRTVGSSLVGYTLDTTLFVLIAFTGMLPTKSIVEMIVIQIGVKMAVEVVASTPMTYVCSRILIRHFK